MLSKNGANPNQDEIDHYWKEVAPLNRNPHLNQALEKPLIQPADYASAAEVETTMHMKTVKMKKDFVVSKTGIDAYDAVKGEELDLPAMTADGLVRDDLAEHVTGKEPAKTANQMNPSFGDSDHVAAIRQARKEGK